MMCVELILRECFKYEDVFQNFKMVFIIILAAARLLTLRPFAR